MDKVWLHQLCWTEVKDYLHLADTIILPVGSIEQHGEHLPLGTDTMVAEALAEAVARQTGVLVGPTVSCGWSPHHMILPGTVTIRPEVLIEYLYDVISSLAEHGFKRFLLLNGHRLVNISWMQIAAERAKRQLHIKVYLADPGFLSKEFARNQGLELIGHADEIESSHMLYLWPGMVDMSRARDFVPQRKEYLHVDPRVGNDVLCYVPSCPEEMRQSVEEGAGVSGSPTRSDPETGKAYHDWVVDRLVSIVNDLKHS
ncbi:MAG: creatininase family protein [Bacillota bacterium]